MPQKGDTKYRVEMCEKLVALGKEGKIPVMWAAEFGVTKVTLREWYKRYPDFAEATDLAWIYAEAYHAQKLIDGSHGLLGPAFKPASAIYWQKAVFGNRDDMWWKDGYSQKDVNVNVTDTRKIEDKREDLRRQLLAKVIKQPLIEVIEGEFNESPSPVQ